MNVLKIGLVLLLAGGNRLLGSLPKNMVIGPNLVTCDGCARLHNLIFPQVLIHGHIDAYNCKFARLDASGYARLIDSRITESLVCRGELTLRQTICAKVFATAKLITLENSHIDELIIELLVLKNRKAVPPKIILTGTSSIERVKFVDTTGSVILKSNQARVGHVIDGTVLTQLPEDQI
ncbi:MAG: hypothetical protein M1426_01525 [Patescibacteria group bacterium]|nr:hypothetical protein [Patescibacteria group bacterium]